LPSPGNPCGKPVFGFFLFFLLLCCGRQHGPGALPPSSGSPFWGGVGGFLCLLLLWLVLLLLSGCPSLFRPLSAARLLFRLALVGVGLFLLGLALLPARPPLLVGLVGWAWLSRLGPLGLARGAWLSARPSLWSGPPPVVVWPAFRLAAWGCAGGLSLSCVSLGVSRVFSFSCRWRLWVAFSVRLCGWFPGRSAGVRPGRGRVPVGGWVFRWRGSGCPFLCASRASPRLGFGLVCLWPWRGRGRVCFGGWRGLFRCPLRGGRLLVGWRVCLGPPPWPVGGPVCGPGSVLACQLLVCRAGLVGLSGRFGPWPVLGRWGLRLLGGPGPGGGPGSVGCGFCCRRVGLVPSGLARRLLGCRVWPSGRGLGLVPGPAVVAFLAVVFFSGRLPWWGGLFSLVWGWGGGTPKRVCLGWTTPARLRRAWLLLLWSYTGQRSPDPYRLHLHGYAVPDPRQPGRHPDPYRSASPRATSLRSQARTSAACQARVDHTCTATPCLASTVSGRAPVSASFSGRRLP
jgi:hypothetical protein